MFSACACRREEHESSAPLKGLTKEFAGVIIVKKWVEGRRSAGRVEAKPLIRHGTAP